MPRVIVDPSALLTDQGLEWISDPELRPFLVVSKVLFNLLVEGVDGELFLPFGVNPSAEQIAALRDGLIANEIATFSFADVEELSEGGRTIRDALLQGDYPLPEVLADEWVFLTTQSLGVISEKAKLALEAFERAGAAVYKVADYKMERGLDAIRHHLPPQILDKMKVVGRFAPKPWLVLGGHIAAYIVPPIGLPIAVIEDVHLGIAVIAGDP